MTIGEILAKSPRFDTSMGVCVEGQWHVKNFMHHYTNSHLWPPITSINKEENMH